MDPNSDKGALFHREAGKTYPVIVRGEGVRLFDSEGKSYIDGISGAGNVTLGHGCSRVVEAMAAQAKTLAYCFSAFFTNQPALDLAARIAALAPGDLNCVYFVSGGSEAIETALKLVRQYHLQQGRSGKQQIISRWRGYHGATMGALAVTGMPALRAPFAPWLADFPKIPACYPYRCALAGCAGTCNLVCADELEAAILQAGPDNVAAFVAEPVVMGGIAVGVPPPDYYRRVREICDRYDVLFIADEVITAFGRTGRYFAIDRWNVVPDLIVFGKGISSGYSPMGGVVMSERIRDSFAASGESFAHVFTYVANPVSARVASTVLDIIEEEGILEHVVEMGAHLQQRADDLAARHVSIGEVRCEGLMMGIELVRDRKTKQPFAADLKVARRIPELTMAKGLHVSATSGVADWVDGDDVRFYPPLIINTAEIDESIDILDEALSELEAEVGVG